MLSLLFIKKIVYYFPLYSGFAPLVIAVIPVLTTSFIPYGRIKSVKALIFGTSPVICIVTVFGVTSTTCPRKILVYWR